MSNETWKLEKDLCRCCHSEGSFKNLSETSDEGQEVYSDMLQFALDINVLPVAGMLCCVTYTICEQCSDRLRDAVSFKRQVLQCEERFRDMYDKDGIKVLTTGDLKVKEEVPEEYPEVDGKPDLPTMDGDDSDDFPLNDLNSEEIKQEDPKKSKPKKAKQKKKLGRPKKTDAGNGEKKDYSVQNIGGSKRYRCKQCRKYFPLVKTIVEHLKEHKESLECPLCNVKFTRKQKRTEHLLNKHGVEETTDESGNIVQKDIKSPCNVCGKEYNVGDIYNRHVRTHKPIKCPECSLEFKDYEIPQHLKEVHNNMSMTCGICGYQVDKRCLMIKHQRRVHLKEKNYTCHICNVNVFGGYDLKKHLVRHNPVKMYECAHCQKRYPRRTTLVQHLKIHAGDKKKVCTICDQRFVQKASLNYHMTKHHPESC